MKKYENIYNRIYSKTLERKNELSKMNDISTTVFSPSVIETEEFLNFPKDRKDLLFNSSAIYLYESILNDKTLIDRKTIAPHTIYNLSDFITRTKVAILISDQDGLIDPELIKVYVTGTNKIVFIINKSDIPYLSLYLFKGIYLYRRYNTNIDVQIPNHLRNSFMVWSKLPNCDSAAIEWIDPIGDNVEPASSYNLPNIGRSVSFSPDGQYIAVAHDISPYFTLLKRNGDNVELASNYTLPGIGQSVSFSPDGQYIAVGHSGSPRFTLLKRNGDSVERASTYTLPSSGYGVSFSPDGQYIAIGHNLSPRFTLLKRNGDNVELASTYTLPSNGLGVSFSPDGRYIAVGHGGSPYFTLLKRNGDNVELASTYTLPSTGRSVSFSPDGQYIAIGHEGHPYFTLLKRNGNTVELASTYTLSNIGYGVSFSPDGQYIAVGHQGSPHFTLLKRNGNTVELASTYTLPNSGYGVSFSPDGQYIAVGHDSSPYFTLLKRSNVTKVPIRAQGGFSILLVTEDLKFHKLTPQSNSKFSYILFPENIGYTNLSNIFIWKNREAGFTQPVFHTPLYDGFKVEDVYRTSLVFDGATGYVSFGSFPGYDNLTLHIRLKVNNFSNLSQILQRGNSDGKGWSLRITSDKRLIFQYKQYDLTKNISSEVLEENKWYDIVITARNNSQYSPFMYINKIQHNAEMIIDSADDSGTDELVLGRQANESQKYADIEVDMIQIYDRILRFTEIAYITDGVAIYDGLKHRWLMNENDGTEIVDDIGSANGDLNGGVVWKKEVDDDSPRLVAFSKRINFVTSYYDLLHKYNEYKDFMDEYINDTLPDFIKNYKPFKPNVTIDSPFSEFESKMLTAVKDFPDFLKNYIEENSAPIHFRSYEISDINPVFIRESTATSVDGKYKTLDINEPRYIKNEDPLKRGVIIEEEVVNKISDPLFENEILLGDSDESNPSNWSISDYNKMISSNTTVKNNVLRHTSFNANNGTIKLNSPSMTIDKSSPLTVHFKIKYVTNTEDHSLWAYGSAVGDAPIKLEQYLHINEMGEDGFIYREYRMPTGTFTGSGDVISFGLWGKENGYDEKDYYLKEFQVLEKSHGLTFTVGEKSKEILKVPSKNVLNPEEGNIEIWFTLKNLRENDKTWIVRNDKQSESEILSIFIESDGRIGTSICGIDHPDKFIVSNPGRININEPYYVSTYWKNGTLRLYLNGTLIGFKTSVPSAIIGEHFYIGSDHEEGTSNIIIHDARISNVGRSSSEISDNYSLVNDLSVDEHTTFKLYYDDFSKVIKLPNELLHPISLTTRHDLRQRLLFVNGLNVAPDKYRFDRISKRWTFWFRANSIHGNRIDELDTGENYEPYYEIKPIETNTVVFGPSSHFNPRSKVDLFEYIPQINDSKGSLRLMNENEYSVEIDENIYKVSFASEVTGNYAAICEKRYNKVISEGHSYDGLLEKLPTWVSFVPKERMLIFLNGRLLEHDRYHLFDPFNYTVVKGDTVIATDLDTNTIDGELFTGYFTTEFELIEYNVQLQDGEKIITLTNKEIPFSKNYFLVFVDGRLIYPGDIKEIDNYRFSIKTNSINNMCIYRKRIDCIDKDKFAGIEDKWTEYLKTLSEQELEELIGPLYQANQGEYNSREVYLTERHLFEILYHYCLKGRESLTEQDMKMIPKELPGTMLPDGRIPISTMRSGPYPRYPL